MLFRTLFLILLASLSVKVMAVEESLKTRQPNWRTKILESFPQGGIEKILFYEPSSYDEIDIPVKVVSYYPSGQIRSETDLTVLPKNHPLIQTFGTAVVPQGFSIDYWPNGVAATVSFYEQGLLHGNFTSYDEASSLKEKGTYNKGKLSGIVERFYPDGTKLSLAHYKEGVLEGEMTQWHPNGVIKSIQYYTRGLLNGDRQRPALRIYNEGRTLIDTQDFRFGRPYGLVNGKQAFLPIPKDLSTQENNPRLPLSDTSEEKIEQDIPDGEYKLYYPSNEGDKEKKIEQVLYYKNGQFHGPQKTFHPNGQLKTLITYQKGVLDGKKAFWNSQGEVLEEAFYRNGDLEGRYYQRRPDGLEIISHYSHHRLDGVEQVFFTPPGSDLKIKLREAVYVDGLLDGELSTYNREGIKVSSSFYKQGKREGVSTLYSPEGRVVMTAEYHNDQKNGKGSEFFSTGNVKSQINFLDDLEDGEEKVFFEDGSLAAHRFYKKGKLDGIAREWDRQGKLIFEAEYKKGLKHGHFLKFDPSNNKWIDRTYENDVLMKSRA